MDIDQSNGAVISMETENPAPIPKLQFTILLWLAGMLGVVALTFTLVPQLPIEDSLFAPLWVVYVVSMAQSAVLVAVSAFLGVLLAPRVGLHAPAFEAAVTKRSVVSALRPQLFPGFLAGVLAGGALFGLGGYASPMTIAEVEPQFTLPLFVRVRYGGLTEELLLRWGLMTLLVWLAWRFLQHRAGIPKNGYIWLAIVVSALLFGAGHLPVVATQVEVLTGYLVLFVIGANSVFGVLFGYLFWRYGLEAAIIAHAMAHIVSYAASLGTA